MDERVKGKLLEGAIRHIAFIMDGNGRWATKKGKSRSEGHRKGAKVFEDTIDYCRSIGIHHVTVYAFSTENWKRPKDEVATLLRLFENYLDTAIKRFVERKVRVVFLGDKSVFSPSIVAKMVKLERDSSPYEDILNIAFNYGGRDEIVYACKRAIADGVEISETTLGERLYTSASPDPDLIVRTAGEMRLSNFLLWQAAYSEFYYTDVLWPDLTHADVDKACEAFLVRKRNFGGIDPKKK